MSYTYDDLSRVTKRTMLNLADSSSSEETFAYDAAGNLIGDHEENVYEYDTDNRLYSYNYCPVSYDADGNTTYAYLDSKTNRFEYDSANRLIKAGAYTYTYNAEDVRIHSTNGTNTTSYVYDTNVRLSRLLVKNTDGTATKYVYGLGLIGEIRTGPFKTYHFDYRGSTVAITDSIGTVTDTFEYDTYGKLTKHIGESATLFLYNGRDGVMTELNGLCYMRARYYSPELKRFINADVVAGEISDAITLNRYAYANGNPVNNIDPFGLEAERGKKKKWSWKNFWTAAATVAVGAIFVAAVVASAGAVGVAAGVTAATIGATGTMVSAANTVGTVSTYAVAVGIGACALSDAGEILTGTNVIRDGLMGGNQKAYDTAQTVLNIVGGGAMIIGQTNPGVTGNAAKPSQDAKVVHKVPTTGPKNTSFDKLYKGNTGNFQRTFYDYKGNTSLQIDFTNHTTPSQHSNVHLHTWGKFGHDKQKNLWYLE